MGQPYVARFEYRGRCPTCEPDKKRAFNVSIGQFVAGPDGKSKPVETEPMPPEKAAELGFTFDRIVGEIAAQAIRERDAAIATQKDGEKEIKALKAQLGEARTEVALLRDFADGARNLVQSLSHGMRRQLKAAKLPVGDEAIDPKVN